MSEQNQFNPEAHAFDVSAADGERLAWRIGHEQPTERALGRDEALARDTAGLVDAERQSRQEAHDRLDARLGDQPETESDEEREARATFYQQRLGTIASGELRPDDN